MIIFDRAELESALKQVKTVVHRTSSIPVLTCALFEVHNSVAHISGTNLKQSLRVAIEAKGQSKDPWSFAVNLDRLQRLVSGLDSQDITMQIVEGDTGTVQVCGGRATTKLFSMDPEAFPPMFGYESEETGTYEIERGKLLDALTTVQHSICADISRYSLNGVLVQLSNDGITCCSTDGRRLTLYTDSENPKKEGGVIVPAQAVASMVNLLRTSTSCTAIVGIVDNRTQMRIDSTVLDTANIEGNFPNFMAVIPQKDSKSIITFTRTALYDALRRAKSMTSDSHNSVNIKTAQNATQLTVTTPEVGQYTEEVECEYECEPRSVALNPDFLIAAIGMVQESENNVRVQIKDENCPVMVLGDTEGRMVRGVIMPIRQND